MAGRKKHLCCLFFFFKKSPKYLLPKSDQIYSNKKPWMLVVFLICNFPQAETKSRVEILKNNFKALQNNRCFTCANRLGYVLFLNFELGCFIKVVVWIHIWSCTINVHWTVHCREQRKTICWSFPKAFHHSSVVLYPMLVNIIVKAMSD